MRTEPQALAPTTSRFPASFRALLRSSASYPSLLFLASLVFFLLTLQPGLAWGDGTRLQREVVTAESFIFAEMVQRPFAPDPYPFARLGVAAWDHPLYVMLGHTLVQAAPAGRALWVTNALSALFAAGTVTLLYLLLYRHTRAPAPALLAAAALAVSHTFWWHAVTPEVYTLFTFLLLLVITFLESYEVSGRFAALLAAAFFLGLGISNHLLAGLALPALLLYLLIINNQYSTINSQWRRLRGRQFVWLGIAFLAGLLPYLVQFLRLLRTFPVGELLGPAAGTTFLQGSLALSPVALGQSLLSYLIFLFYNFLLLGVFLGLYGWWAGRLPYPLLWAKALAGYLVYLIFGLVYQVSDQFAFFLAAHLFWAIALGLGLALAGRAAASGRRQRLLYALFALSILLTPLFYHLAPGLLRAAGVDEAAFGVPLIGSGVRDGLAYYIDPNKAGDHAAETFGHETLASLPPDALVIAEWYTDTDEYFVLRYYAAVEGLRPDVTVLGWPTADPFSFDSALVTDTVAANITARPIYLASLSEQFYAAPRLLDQTCIVPEHNLYRVYPLEEAASRSCLPPAAATP
ncbi:MAG: protein O-mannosyl-transferase family [Candidatus Promineifilaceae bacterium]